MVLQQPTHETPPPLKDLPTAKQKKYDRQLRLWGATGQEALEQTHVLLINNGTGVTGVETLKNLVLPGIGNFTIADSSQVTEADLGVNFFLDDDSLGKFRADETVRLLVELNPDVKGHAKKEPLEEFVGKDFTPYTLILVTAPIDPALLSTIQSKAQELGVPVFYVHCIGYYSHFSLQLPPAFPIVDTHPDPTATTDLRLTKPWAALSEFAKEKTTTMSMMKPEDKAHIPYVCLLLHYLEEWKITHDGNIPDSYKEKIAFRDLVRGGSPDEENFDEACAAVLKALNPPTPSSTVRDILNAPEAQSITSRTPSFWLIAHAIHSFYQTHGQLPLPGSVPDMKATSSDYITLQNIYKTKARTDAAEVLNIVRQLEETTSRPAELQVHETEIENFCKQAAHIALVRGRPFQIVSPSNSTDSGSVSKTRNTPITFGDRAKSLANDLTNPESLLPLYLAFIAWDEFIATHSSSPTSNPTAPSSLTPPGSTRTPQAFEQDASKLGSVAHSLMDSLIKEAASFVEEPDYGNLKLRLQKYCTELTRAGGGELHNLAALTGGMVSQEAIKVITRQYVPVDNVVVFDGVGSRAGGLRV
ncbi:hypothetical protein MBLNU230_g2995t1 [Neophaeotheca triangularis]